MAKFFANYVKFLRGTPEAFEKLKTKDIDTLYFIAEKDSLYGKLYLGNILISSSLEEDELIEYVSKNELKEYLKSYHNNEEIESLLDNKVDKVYYPVLVFDEDGNPVYEEDGITQKEEKIAGILLSPQDKAKLDALVLNDGDIEISGKVNANNIENLDEWINDNRNSIPGLYSGEAEIKLNKAISDLDTLEEKVKIQSAHQIITNAQIDDIAKQLNDYIDASTKDLSNLNNRIEDLKDAVTWEII